MLGTYLKLFAYYNVNGNDLRLRSEVTAVHFDQDTAEVTAVPYGTARPYTKELYTAVPYYTVRYGFGRIVTGYGRSLRYSTQKVSSRVLNSRNMMSVVNIGA